MSNPKETNTKHIKCMSFNIRAGTGMDDVYDMHRIAEVIKKSEADIIGLNEVDCCTERSKGIDQARFIAEKLNYYSAYGKTMDYNGGQYGNAFLSRYPILSIKNHCIPSSAIGENEPRCILECKIEIEGSLYTILTTHFGFILEEGIEAVEYIKSKFNYLKQPVILMGDFNLIQETDFCRLEPLLNKFKDTAQDLGKELVLKTFDSHQPKRKIDYIMVSHGFKVISADVIQTNASDHLPLIAEVVYET